MLCNGLALFLCGGALLARLAWFCPEPQMRGVASSCLLPQLEAEAPQVSWTSGNSVPGVDPDTCSTGGIALACISPELWRIHTFRS